MSPIPVLPLVRGDDGVLEAVIVPVVASDDVLVLEDLEGCARSEEPVRIGDEVRRLPVYRRDDERYVSWRDAFPEEG